MEVDQSSGRKNRRAVESFSVNKGSIPMLRSIAFAGSDCDQSLKFGHVIIGWRVVTRLCESRIVAGLQRISMRRLGRLRWLDIRLVTRVSPDSVLLVLCMATRRIVVYLLIIRDGRSRGILMLGDAARVDDDRVVLHALRGRRSRYAIA